MLSSMAHFARVLCFIWRFTEKCFVFDVEKEINDWTIIIYATYRLMPRTNKQGLISQGKNLDISTWS